MKCQDCKFFNENRVGFRGFGRCSIDLPVWLRRADVVFDIDPNVTADDGCDLGTPR